MTATPTTRRYCAKHQRPKLPYSAGPLAKPAYRCPLCIAAKNRAYRLRLRHRLTG